LLGSEGGPEKTGPRTLPIIIIIIIIIFSGFSDNGLMNHMSNLHYHQHITSSLRNQNSLHTRSKLSAFSFDRMKSDEVQTKFLLQMTYGESNIIIIILEHLHVTFHKHTREFLGIKIVRSLLLLLLLQVLGWFLRKI